MSDSVSQSPAGDSQETLAALSRWREAILTVTGQAAERILGSQLDHEAFTDALRLLGEATRVSRVYVFQNHGLPDGRIASSQRYEWCGSGVVPQLDNPDLQGLCLEDAGFGRWIAEFAANRPIFGVVSDFPESEQALLTGQGIVSLVAMPIFTHGALWGFIGFDDCVVAHRWTNDTVGCLRVAARVLGSAFERMDYKRQSDRLLAEYQQLLDSVSEVLFRADCEGRWQFLSPAWVEMSGWEVAQSVGRPYTEFLQASDREAMERVFAEVVCGVRTLGRCETRLQRASGEARWTLFTLRLLRDLRGRAQGVAGTITDIHEAKESEAALIEARTAAEAANRAKSEFLSTMSHELRTPLNAVLGLTESLLEMEPPYDPERTRRYLGIIHRSGKQLLAQINDILDLARIEAGRVEPDRVRTDLGLLCASAAEGVRKEAAAKSLTVDVGRAAAGPVAMVDERLFRQVLSNLLGNAVKFTPEGGRISISASVAADGRRAELAVRDTGIGIAPEKIGLLFKPFTQADSSLSRRFGGTGLGLAIVDRLVRLHGGMIRVESTPGVGSVFVIDLPLADQVSPPSGYVVVPSDAPRVALVGGGDGWALIEGFLAERGFAAVRLGGPEAAVAALATGLRAALIVVDLVAPVNEALAFIRAMRASPTHGAVPILALTSADTPDEAAVVRAAGAHAHVAKPVKLAALAAGVSQLTGVTL